MSVLSGILAALQALPLIDAWIKRIIALFQKPIAVQIADDEKKHDEAVKNAAENNNTDGLFGG